MTEDLKYIQVGDLAKGITGNILPDSDELTGRSLKLFFEDGSIMQIRFNSVHRMTWEALEGLEKGSRGDAAYRATSLRKGIEKGLADTDQCHYFKIAEALYLFVWREKIVPTLGVVMVDLNAMKTTGKLFGFEGDDFSRLTNIPIGAHAILLNVTNYY